MHLKRIGTNITQGQRQGMINESWCHPFGRDCVGLPAYLGGFDFMRQKHDIVIAVVQKS